jgi:hypothetical protein
MGVVMIKCPQTGRKISTGIRADKATYGRMPVFFSRTFCPICRVEHVWFAKEAWIEEDSQNVRSRDVVDGSVSC